MKILLKTLLVFLGLVLSFSAFAQTSTFVPGYVKKNGTYVEPYWKTTPNSTKLDNYSTKPNENPFTGKEGKVILPDPYSTPTTTFPKAETYQPQFPVYRETRQATQCIGLTKKGYLCSRMTTSLSGYCFQHQ